MGRKITSLYQILQQSVENFNRFLETKVSYFVLLHVSFVVQSTKFSNCARVFWPFIQECHNFKAEITKGDFLIKDCRSIANLQARISANCDLKSQFYLSFVKSCHLGLYMHKTPKYKITLENFVFFFMNFKNVKTKRKTFWTSHLQMTARYGAGCT